MSDEKMVKESDLIAVKKSAQEREKKFKDQIDELNKRVADNESKLRQAESQSKVLQANVGDDEEQKKVREFLLAEDARVQDLIRKHEDSVASFGKREREVRARELLSDLKSKGVEITKESLLEAEDMDKRASETYTEFLVKQNEELKTKPVSAEGVFDKGSGANITKGVWDLSDKEFSDKVQKLKVQALSK